ncbi:inositol monophosphatase family protein [Pelagibacterium sp.]|uniref:inositol monophosphatase family protein n=1 Tax=Pelagibacterium sp. TaxID=1967288 RepID=UPI003A8F05DC
MTTRAINLEASAPETKEGYVKTQFEDRLLAAEDIAEQVGRFATGQAKRRTSLTVSAKGPQDFVSTADIDAERMARQLIAERFPNDAILGEEAGGELADSCWIIDPIDGTTNFLSGLPLWSVSIAYVQDGVPVVGALALPMMGDLVAAASGSGVRRNRRPLAPVQRSGPKLAGIGRNLPWLAEGYRDTERLLEAAGYSLVSLGSCATELAFVALGSLEGYVQHQVSIWDIAAGVIVCREAGLLVDVTPGPTAKVNVIAGSADFGRTLGLLPDCQTNIARKIPV